MRRVMYYFAIFFIIGAIEYGHCELKCYSCSSRKDPACISPDSNQMALRRCDYQALQDMKTFAESVDPKFGTVFEFSIQRDGMPLIPMNCLKQVTVVDKEEYIIRGCQFSTDQHLDICKKVDETAKKERINVTHCSMCNHEGCNLAPHSHTFTFASALVALGIHLLKLIVS